MVIHDLHVERIAVFPAKNDPPLVVDANRVKAFPITFESFSPIARGDSQIIELGRVVQEQQLSPGSPTQFLGNPSDSLRLFVVEQILGQPVTEALYHNTILS